MIACGRCVIGRRPSIVGPDNGGVSFDEAAQDSSEKNFAGLVSETPDLMPAFNRIADITIVCWLDPIKGNAVTCAAHQRVCPAAIRDVITIVFGSGPGSPQSGSDGLIRR